LEDEKLKIKFMWPNIYLIPVNLYTTCCRFSNRLLSLYELDGINPVKRIKVICPASNTRLTCNVYCSTIVGPRATRQPSTASIKACTM